MSLASLIENQAVILPLLATVAVAFAAYLLGRERGVALGSRKLSRLTTELDLDNTLWSVAADRNSSPDGIDRPVRLQLRQSGSRIFGNSPDGRVSCEGSTSGRKLCLVFADRGNRSERIGAITAEIDPETEAFSGLRAECQPDACYLVTPVKMTRVLRSRA